MSTKLRPMLLKAIELNTTEKSAPANVTSPDTSAVSTMNGATRLHSPLPGRSFASPLFRAATLHPPECELGG